MLSCDCLSVPPGAQLVCVCVRACVCVCVCVCVRASVFTSTLWLEAAEVENSTNAPADLPKEAWSPFRRSRLLVSPTAQASSNLPEGS